MCVSPLLASEPRFLRSLWQMCAEEPCGGTIRWGKTRAYTSVKPRLCPHADVLPLPADASGKRIIITSQKVMEAKVLSRIGGCSSSWTTFQRQLNYFGFKREFGTSDLPGKPKLYSNPLFRRDHPEQVERIQRKEGTRKRKRAPAAKDKAEVEVEVEVQAASRADLGLTLGSSSPRSPPTTRWESLATSEAAKRQWPPMVEKVEEVITAEVAAVAAAAATVAVVATAVAERQQQEEFEQDLHSVCTLLEDDLSKCEEDDLAAIWAAAEDVHEETGKDVQWEEGLWDFGL